MRQLLLAVAMFAALFASAVSAADFTYYEAKGSVWSAHSSFAGGSEIVGCVVTIRVVGGSGYSSQNPKLPPPDLFKSVLIFSADAGPVGCHNLYRVGRRLRVFGQDASDYPHIDYLIWLTP